MYTFKMVTFYTQFNDVHEPRVYNQWFKTFCETKK